MMHLQFRTSMWLARVWWIAGLLLVLTACRGNPADRGASRAATDQNNVEDVHAALLTAPAVAPDAAELPHHLPRPVPVRHRRARRCALRAARRRGARPAPPRRRLHAAPPNARGPRCAAGATAAASRAAAGTLATARRLRGGAGAKASSRERPAGGTCVAFPAADRAEPTSVSMLFTSERARTSGPARPARAVWCPRSRRVTPRACRTRAARGARPPRRRAR